MSKNRGNKKVEECILSIEGLRLNTWNATPNSRIIYSGMGIPLERVPMLNEYPVVDITATIGDTNMSICLSGEFTKGDYNKILQAHENGKPLKLSLTI